ncbi:hypothetical protein [Streptomyces lancefieldiae]|uniref:DUF2283 domain-containing protein n=1 Tax=Streptomyces lancefieldiae TaxID=3075520 RepID=A0ABU3AF18_9ACTN|nr:hypothetical protein [Streptomyces sp. DSM 40712]MDT0608784.1 hypothetical protein [Streptomyces sp. DSM 40712]
MSESYQFTDKDGDVAGVEFINDAEQGPVLWLQTTPNGCYIPTARLAEFIDGLKNTADQTATSA